ncbi:MAG: hypothetical protein M3N17_06545 [Actinomycetota bacterium]|nr:hypothetical protein [Actinomycetota bacterium]
MEDRAVIVVLVAPFAINVPALLLAAMGESLTHAPQIAELLWTLNAAFFALTPATLAVALGGFGVAPRNGGPRAGLDARGGPGRRRAPAHRVGPRRAGGPDRRADAGGGCGFAAWLLFPFTAGYRLLRADAS